MKYFLMIFCGVLVGFLLIIGTADGIHNNRKLLRERKTDASTRTEFLFSDISIRNSSQQNSEGAKVNSKIFHPSIAIESVFTNLFMQQLAGGSSTGFNGDNGPASSSSINCRIPYIDLNGVVYLPDSQNARIRKISPTRLITTFGGTGTQSTVGISGSITSVQFKTPYSIVGDSPGTFLYISDDYYVWKYDFSTNIISVYAGTSTQGFNGDNGPAGSAQLAGPKGLWLTTSLVLYIADYSNCRIRKVSGGIITTVAGTSNQGYGGDNGQATSASLNVPYSCYLNTAGRLFIADAGNNRIRVVEVNGIISTFAGNGATAYNGNNLQATATAINLVEDVKGDSSGNIYFTDYWNCMVRKVSASGIVTTMFGTAGSCGYSPGFSPRESSVGHITGIALDSLGTIYFSDENSLHMGADPWPTSQPTAQPSAQPVLHPSGQPTTRPTGSPSFHPRSFENINMQLVGGIGLSGYTGDSGPATSAQIRSNLMWVDSSGNIYFPDDINFRIRKIDSSGIVTTFGGQATSSIAGTSGAINSVNFFEPWSIVGDVGRTVLYICDQRYIWKYVFSTNIVAVFAHSTALGAGFSGDNGPAELAQLSNPAGIWLTTSGVLFIADYHNHRIRKIVNGIISTVVGSGCGHGCSGSFSGDNGPALSATLNDPLGIYVDTVGRLFIADEHNFRIRLVETNGIIQTFAGSGSESPFNGDALPALSANIHNVFDLKGDSLGNIYISDNGNCVIRMIDTRGIISVVFGSPGQCDYSAGISLRTAKIKNPGGLWVDSLANIYFSGYGVIYRSINVFNPTSQPSVQPSKQPITPPTAQPSVQPSSKPSRIALTIDTPNLFKKRIAGASSYGYNGDNMAATAAKIDGRIPWIDSSGNIYLPDAGNFRIRKINPAGIIATFTGTGTQSSSGTGGPVTSLSVNIPWSIIGDTTGTFLYFSDEYYIWKYFFSNNIVSLVAGKPTKGFSGDNGPASLAELNGPDGLWLTTGGDLYFADEVNHRIRRISTGLIITTVAGSASPAGYSGDGGPATSATLKSPASVYVDTVGKLFIADYGNHRVRLVQTNNIITTFAGAGGTAYNGNNIAATAANVWNPQDMKGDSYGNIYLGDYGNCLVRLVDMHGIISTLFGSGTCGFTPGIISSATTNVGSVIGLWLDSASNLYFCDINSLYRSYVVSSPTSQPTGCPTAQPVISPSNRPSSQPTGFPTSQPNQCPTAQPSRQPDSAPTLQPGSAPTAQPSSAPTHVSYDSLLQQCVSRECTPDQTGQSGNCCWQNSCCASSTACSYVWKSTTTAQTCTCPCCLNCGAKYNSECSGCRTDEHCIYILPVVPLGTNQFCTDQNCGGRYQCVPLRPSSQPSTQPTSQPFLQPTSRPTNQPSSRPSCQPSEQPSSLPTRQPTVQPSSQPTSRPTGQPTDQPSSKPSCQPIGQPWSLPTRQPTVQPSSRPSCQPIGQPWSLPTRQPTVQPSGQPTSRPTGQPTDQPSSKPSCQPSEQPSSLPTRQPTVQPSSRPTRTPSVQSSAQPADQPSGRPSCQPSRQPTVRPSSQPTSKPSCGPSTEPNSMPTRQPTGQSSSVPTAEPSSRPSCGTSWESTNQPSSQPSAHPSNRPSAQPTTQPTSRPTGQPSRQPSSQPSGQPSRQPSSQPSRQPSRQPSVKPSLCNQSPEFSTFLQSYDCSNCSSFVSTHRRSKHSTDDLAIQNPKCHPE
jgi:hypothetical protein